MQPEQFKATLKGLGMSGTELAELVDVTRKQVSAWATGRAPVPRSIELVLAAVRTIGADQLVALVELDRDLAELGHLVPPGA